MRAPQYGRFKGRRRGSQTALPRHAIKGCEYVSKPHAGQVESGYVCKRYNLLFQHADARVKETPMPRVPLGLPATLYSDVPKPARDKPKSRNDTRIYQWAPRYGFARATAPHSGAWAVRPQRHFAAYSPLDLTVALGGRQ